MADTSAWNRVSPLSALFFIFKLLKEVGPQALPGVLVLFAALAGGDSEHAWLPLLLLLLAVILSGFGVLSWLRFRYRVAGDRVLVRRGVLQREELDIDFDRIQNINIREPFYMRPLGLAVLAIDTAGSSGKEVELAGIARDLALEIRSELLDEARARSPGPAAEAADGDLAGAAAEEPATASVLLELGRRDVLVYGLTANVMLWAALAIGAVFGTGDVAEDTIGALVKSPEVQATAEALRREGGTLLLGLAVSGLFFFVLLMLPLISMLGALFRYDGYRLTLQDETFRRSSGLLTRHDESLRRHKIQAVVWKQNFIARWLGRVNLQLRQASAGSGSEEAQAIGLGKSAFQVPALRPVQAAALTATFLPGSDSAGARFSPVDQGRFVRVNLVIVLVIATLPLLTPSVLVHPAFFALLAPIGFVAWWILRRVARAFGWAVDGEFGYFRQGFIGHTTTVFPLFKVQRVDIRQTPIQHRRGIAHLTVHLASHSLTLPYVGLKDANRLRDLALYAAESSRRRWY